MPRGSGRNPTSFLLQTPSLVPSLVRLAQNSSKFNSFHIAHVIPVIQGLGDLVEFSMLALLQYVSPNSFPLSGTKSFISLFLFVFISTLFSVCIAFCTPKCWCIPLLLQPHLCVATTFHNCSSYTLNYGIDIPCVECQLALPFSLTVDSPVHLGVFVVFPINVHGFLLRPCKPFVCWRWRRVMPPDIECEYERKKEENENERRRELMEKAVFQSCTLA